MLRHFDIHSESQAKHSFTQERPFAITAAGRTCFVSSANHP